MHYAAADSCRCCRRATPYACCSPALLTSFAACYGAAMVLCYDRFYAAHASCHFSLVYGFAQRYCYAAAAQSAADMLLRANVIPRLLC